LLLLAASRRAILALEREGGWVFHPGEVVARPTHRTSPIDERTQVLRNPAAMMLLAEIMFSMAATSTKHANRAISAQATRKRVIYKRNKSTYKRHRYAN
jgi:hypothetical protein